MGDGEPAAQATIGPGPTELVLEARGPDLLITLVSLAPPARVVAGGLLIDAAKMRAASCSICSPSAPVSRNHRWRGSWAMLAPISPAAPARARRSGPRALRTG